MNNSKIIEKDLKQSFSGSVEEDETIEDIEDIEEDLEQEEEKIEAPKKKKVLNENQRKAVAINLQKGRENLKKTRATKNRKRKTRKRITNA